MAPTDRGKAPSAVDATSKLAVVGRVTAPPLTIWLGSAMCTFPADRDVTAGRDRMCDIYLSDEGPAIHGWISRTHAILRFDGTQWVAIDRSQNGIFVEGARADLVTIRGRQSITLGSPRGPRLTFRVASLPARPTPRNVIIAFVRFRLRLRVHARRRPPTARPTARSRSARRAVATG